MAQISLNDHLSDMMDRLMNEDLKEEELRLELARAKAVGDIAKRKIELAKAAINAAKSITSGDIDEHYLDRSVAMLPPKQQ